MDTELNIFEKIDTLNEIGIALSSEANTARLMEKILLNAKLLTNADGGTLYKVVDHNLEFDVVLNDSLNIKLGGTFTDEVPFPPISLKECSDLENICAVAAYVANKGEFVNIEDIYHSSKFDFSGALKFDKKMNYQTKSMLVIPFKNFENNVIGVIQLINAKNKLGETIAFDRSSETMVRSIASQASIALSNKKLVDAHKILFKDFSQMIADAIDKKSPYTGKHCQRVPIITMMLAHAANKTDYPPLKDFTMDEDDLFQLNTAAWLHDCGKLATPEYIMDKSTKLETVFDRIELIKTRLTLKAFQDLAKKHSIPKSEIVETLSTYQSTYDKLKQINIGSEFLIEGNKQFIENIYKDTIDNLDGSTTSLITDDEKENLMIKRGTLNDKEIDIMHYHANMTIKMLDVLPFPRELANVKEYAGGHHEKLDGSGYPNNLTKEQLSIPARIMCIADIFEALTATDRPYKEARKLSETLNTLGHLKKIGHIDGDLFDVFIKEKVYLEYANKYLDPKQIDEVDHSKIPCYEE